MKAKFICRQCKKENEFETEGQRTSLMEMKVQVSEPITYIVNCPYCGTENSVKMWVKDQ